MLETMPMALINGYGLISDYAMAVLICLVFRGDARPHGFVRIRVVRGFPACDVRPGAIGTFSPRLPD